MDWPPTPGEVQASLSEWDAWYRGSADRLDAVYGQRTFGVRPSQLAGGLVGGVGRFLWGNPVPQTKKYRMHLPLAADIASASSDLLFGQETPIVFPDASKAARDRMQLVMEGNGWQSLLAESGELASALGGTYLRAGWDADVADHALITTMDADAAVPEFQYGRLVEVTFWTVVDKSGHVVRRYLETHRPGSVEPSLWEGTKDKLGRRIPLAESTFSAGVAATVDGVRAEHPARPRLARYQGGPAPRPERLWRSRGARPVQRDRRDLDLLDARPSARPVPHLCLSVGAGGPRLGGRGHVRQRPRDL